MPSLGTASVKIWHLKVFSGNVSKAMGVLFASLMQEFYPFLQTGTTPQPFYMPASRHSSGLL